MKKDEILTILEDNIKLNKTHEELAKEKLQIEKAAKRAERAKNKYKEWYTEVIRQNELWQEDAEKWKQRYWEYLNNNYKLVSDYIHRQRKWHDKIKILIKSW